jgi:hypothetical protein
MTTLDRSDPHALAHAESFVDDLLRDMPETVTVVVDKADAKRGNVTVDLSDYVGDIHNEALDDFAATYDRYINKAGVPVRRLVLTGPEEVDNAAVQAAA